MEPVPREIAGLFATHIGNSYSPYSNFKVCAVVRSKHGENYVGVNVENTSFGLTICAERAAICTAISQGCREFNSIYIMWYASKHPDCSLVTIENEC